MTTALPKLETYEEHGSDWNKYVEAIYDIFKKDFIYSSPKWQPDDVFVRINSSPMDQGKEFTFWHITSEGDVEKDRTPNFRRCERIRFPRYLIEHFKKGPVLAWEKEVQKKGKGREKRIHISTDDFSYLVVLSPIKNNKRTMITAYYIDSESNKKRLKGDHQKFQLK